MLGMYIVGLSHCEGNMEGVFGVYLLLFFGCLGVMKKHDLKDTCGLLQRSLFLLSFLLVLTLLAWS